MTFIWSLSLLICQAQNGKSNTKVNHDPYIQSRLKYINSKNSWLFTKVLYFILKHKIKEMDLTYFFFLFFLPI